MRHSALRLRRQPLSNSPISATAKELRGMYDFVIIGGGIIGMSTAMQLIDLVRCAHRVAGKRVRAACHW